MSLFAARENAAELEERKRLLYVAVTRAASYLILSSSLESQTKLKSDWMKLLAERFNLESGELVARLPDGYGTPLVRVHALPEQAERARPVDRAGPTLLKMLDEAHRLSAAGQGIVPREVAAHCGRPRGPAPILRLAT